MSESVAEEALPVMFEHCGTVYRAMRDRSVAEDDPNTSLQEASDTHIIYEGFLTKLFAELKLSVPYYSKCMKELTRMGCVQQIRRGGASTPSRFELLREPTRELWSYANPTQATRPKTPQEQQAAQINELTNRVNDLDKKYETLVQGLITAKVLR